MEHDLYSEVADVVIGLGTLTFLMGLVSVLLS
jgi:hypothetical protein